MRYEKPIDAMAFIQAHAKTNGRGATVTIAQPISLRVNGAIDYLAKSKLCSVVRTPKGDVVIEGANRL